MVVLERGLAVVAGVGDHDLGGGRRLLMRWEVEELTEVKPVWGSAQNAVFRHLLDFWCIFCELLGVRPSIRACQSVVSLVVAYRR